MRFIVEGDAEHRSHGVVRCSLLQTDRYDHKRHHADRGSEVFYNIWDFLVWRDDGSCIALHPNYTNTKVSCTIGIPFKDHAIPRNGKGGSNGPNTFRGFKAKQCDRILRFDATKKVAQMPQSRCEPKRAARVHNQPLGPPPMRIPENTPQPSRRPPLPPPPPSDGTAKPPPPKFQRQAIVQSPEAEAKDIAPSPPAQKQPPPPPPPPPLPQSLEHGQSPQAKAKDTAPQPEAKAAKSPPPLPQLQLQQVLVDPIPASPPWDALPQNTPPQSPPAKTAPPSTEDIVSTAGATEGDLSRPTSSEHEMEPSVNELHSQDTNESPVSEMGTLNHSPRSIIDRIYTRAASSPP